MQRGRKRKRTLDDCAPVTSTPTKRRLSHPPSPRSSRSPSSPPSAWSSPTPISPPPQALTEDNLRRLEQEDTMAPRARNDGSPERLPVDIKSKLAANDVLVDIDAQLPQDLRALVDRITNPTRILPPSPNARSIVDNRRYAELQNERNGIDVLEPYLLFRGEAQKDTRVTGEPFIVSKQELILLDRYLPCSPNSRAVWSSVEKAKPDTAIGYVTRDDAAASGCQAAFTRNQEEVLRWYSPTSFLHAPFASSQWKPQNGEGNLSHARYQAARDGAVCVNYNWEFFSVAHGRSRTPTPVETCHFSTLCDMETAQLWVHWRQVETEEDDDGEEVEVVKHHMEHVHTVSLRNHKAVLDARQMEKNILAYAVGDRLKAIKHAIPGFSQNKAMCETGEFRRATKAKTATSSSSSVPPSVISYALPPTPSSPAPMSEPEKKRQKRGHALANEEANTAPD